jgi:hypothetical protein
MESLFSTKLAITLEIFKIFKLQAKESTKIYKMDTIMKVNGRKIYSTVMEFRNMLIKISIKEDLCVGVNLVKDNINFQMERSM